MMKSIKISLLLLSLLIIFGFLAGCRQKTVPTAAGTEKTISTAVDIEKDVQDYNKLFQLKLFSDKQIYKTTDKINIWATLEYTGTNESIEIWHGDPYISFNISDGKEFNIVGIVEDVLMSTLLEKGKLYKFNYTKSGGYSNDDPKADYWQKFYAEKDLYLPEGEYTIRVGGAFSLSKDVGKSSNNLSKELKIKVTK